MIRAPEQTASARRRPADRRITSEAVDDGVLRWEEEEEEDLCEDDEGVLSAIRLAMP